MMSYNTKEHNGKSTYTNKVCHTLQLGGSWNLVTLKFRVGEGGWERRKIKKYFLGGCPIREVFLRERLAHWPSIQIGNFHMPWWDSYPYIQSYLVVLLHIFHLFSATKSKHTTCNLKYLKRQKVGRGHLIFIFRGDFRYEGN